MKKIPVFFPSPPPAQRVAGEGWGEGVVRHERSLLLRHRPLIPAFSRHADKRPRGGEGEAKLLRPLLKRVPVIKRPDLRRLRSGFGFFGHQREQRIKNRFAGFDLGVVEF